MLQPQNVSAQLAAVMTARYRRSPLSWARRLLCLTGPWCSLGPRCSAEACSRLWPAEVSAQQRQVVALPGTSCTEWLSASCPLLLQRPSQGYNITVFHSMHAEVENYQVHHWTVSTQLQPGALQPNSSFSCATDCGHGEQTSPAGLLELVALRPAAQCYISKKAGSNVWSAQHLCEHACRWPDADFVASDGCCTLAPRDPWTIEMRLDADACLCLCLAAPAAWSSGCSVWPAPCNHGLWLLHVARPCSLASADGSPAVCNHYP